MSVLSFAIPRDHEETIALTEAFFREGCVLIPGVLSADEVVSLRNLTDVCAADPNTPPHHVSYAGTVLVLRRCHELGRLFNEMITREPITIIVESILGKGAAFNAMNVIRNEPGKAIARWHVDDVLEFPLPEEIARFDPRIKMPVLWMTVQVALSDIDSLEHGPTQYVPGSHYSGRQPSDPDNPTFEGHGPESVFCKAGDIYLTNHQCWHRGAPNVFDRTRYVMQLQYAARWADRRFRGVA